jgi:MbtH protein
MRRELQWSSGPLRRDAEGNTQLQSGAAMSWGDENSNFVVVVNHEEQYSIWPDYKAIPAGWREAGKSGKKDECLQWIDEVWTDMRPLSLRQAMAGGAGPEGVTNA